MFKKRIVKKDKQPKKDEQTKRRFEDDNDDEPLSVLLDSKPAFKKQAMSNVMHLTKQDNEEDRLKDLNEKKKELKLEEERAAIKSGPLKPIAENVKTTTLTDFQPDVCKDFMKTGYCGYGDTCKFLHIRNELRQKKKISKDWQIDTPKSKKDDERLPFKCVLCEEDYKSPIKTDCGHIYCKSCFLTRYKRKKSECFICSFETNGVIKPVSKLELSSLID